MSSDDETQSWLAQADAAAQALRGLRQRLLALHAELSAIREAMGVVAEAPAATLAETLDAMAPTLAETENESGEGASFVWPPGRTPN